jgi:ABC-type sugar transport system permease subunit
LFGPPIKVGVASPIQEPEIYPDAEIDGQGLQFDRVFRIIVPLIFPDIKVIEYVL